MESFENKENIDLNKLAEIKMFLLSKKSILGDDMFTEIQVPFVDELRQKYDPKTLNGSRLYHELIGSTPMNAEEITSLDLPEGEIENFIMNA